MTVIRGAAWPECRALFKENIVFFLGDGAFMDWQNRASKMAKHFSHLETLIEWHESIEGRHPRLANSLSIGGAHLGTNAVLHDTVKLASELASTARYLGGNRSRRKRYSVLRRNIRRFRRRDECHLNWIQE